MNYFELRFDYGAWSCEIHNKRGVGRSISDWAIVAMWRAWRRMP